MRTSGILMPISSLPGPYGIGTFSKEAYRFVDQLKAGGQKLWQILPLGPTGFGDSPYQSFSTFAGNPYFIDLQEFIDLGYITHEECMEATPKDSQEEIKYGEMFSPRFALLHRVFEQVNLDRLEGYESFCEENHWWIDDYALFMALKDFYGGASFTQWNDGLRHRDDKVLHITRKGFEDEVHFYKYLQYMFYKQWGALKTYANEAGVQIVGDLPIYVAFDSADTWSNPDLFQMSEEGLPSAVAGCPPDGFSPDGQLWGNPLYNWEYHKSTGYEWWIKRIAHCYKLYDVLRIDHFRGFDEYYAIPFEAETAVDGTWEKGPGIDLFHAVKNKLGDLPMIAEDLGFLTPSVIRLVEETGFPGMKILEFAFDSRDESNYLPHLYDKNAVVYTGTHDNDTVLGWFADVAPEDLEFAREYLGVESLNRSNVAAEMIRVAMASVADSCIIPIQDYLNLGSESRINTPSTLGNNWAWRMKSDAVTEEVIEKMEQLTRVYGR